MATIVGELISKNPVELHPVHDQPGYYYVPQRTEFIVKKDGFLYEPQNLVGGLSSKMSLNLSPKRDPSITDKHSHEYYYVIPNKTEFVLRRTHHGSAGSNEVINFVTCVHYHYDEPRLIKCCENDDETILVAINNFIVQEEYTVNIKLTCDFNPQDELDDYLTEIVDDIYKRYHQNNPISKTGISFNINVSPTRTYVFASEVNKVVLTKKKIIISHIDIEPSSNSLNSPDTIEHIKTVIYNRLSPSYNVSGV